MTKLKPCPFCGGKAKLFSAKANTAGTRFVYWVECNLEGTLTCGCIPKTWQCDTAEEAVETWNKRTEADKRGR